MGLSVPYRRTKDKEVLFKDILLDMAPESRQCGVSLSDGQQSFFDLSGRFGFSKNQDHIEVDKIEPYFFFDIELYSLDSKIDLARYALLILSLIVYLFLLKILMAY